MMKNPNGSWQARPYFWETPTDKIGSGFVAKEFFFSSYFMYTFI